jgi:hypothetical protein
LCLSNAARKLFPKLGVVSSQVWHQFALQGRAGFTYGRAGINAHAARRAEAGANSAENALFASTIRCFAFVHVHDDCFLSPDALTAHTVVSS